MDIQQLRGDTLASSSKQNDVKKAIKAVAKEKGFRSHNSYHRITNSDILDWMIKNRCGTQWITEQRIRLVRRTMPKMYNEKK